MRPRGSRLVLLLVLMVLMVAATCSASTRDSRWVWPPLEADVVLDATAPHTGARDHEFRACNAPRTNASVYLRCRSSSEPGHAGFPAYGATCDCARGLLEVRLDCSPDGKWYAQTPNICGTAVDKDVASSTIAYGRSDLSLQSASGSPLSTSSSGASKVFPVEELLVGFISVLVTVVAALGLYVSVQHYRRHHGATKAADAKQKDGDKEYPLYEYIPYNGGTDPAGDTHNN